MSYSIAWKLKSRQFVCSSLAAFIAASLMAVAANARAATMNLIATQDTWITGQFDANGYNNTTNHNLDDLWFDGRGTNSKRETSSWLQFNLSQLPANAQINSAHLELYMFYLNGTVSASGINGSTHSDASGTVTFNETSFSMKSYANGGAFDTPYALNERPTAQVDLGDFPANTLGAINNWYQSLPANNDDKALLQSIYNAGGSLVVRLIMPSESGTHQVQFTDREGTGSGGNTTFAPRLVVDYTTVPEPSGIIMAGLGIIGLGSCLRIKRRKQRGG